MAAPLQDMRDGRWAFSITSCEGWKLGYSITSCEGWKVGYSITSYEGWKVGCSISSCEGWKVALAVIKIGGEGGRVQTNSNCGRGGVKFAVYNL